MGVYSAVLEFNLRRSGIEQVMIKAGIRFGKMQQICTERISDTRKERYDTSKERKSSDKFKQRRKVIRYIQKKWTDKNMKRKSHGKRKRSSPFKRRRKMTRSINKRWIDNNKQTEEKTCETGAF